MKIGLLAYHAACNFGAFLQLLSTVEYIKKRGDEPLVINWIPKDFEKDYNKKSSEKTRALFKSMREKYYPLTQLCRSDKDVAKIIDANNIDAVIVGSDAVCQHHPFRERFHFPTKRIIYLAHPTSDRMYPNCFWGTFNNYLRKSIPVAVISGSSQDSKYFFIKGRTKYRMRKSILKFDYMSVRDEWTQKMVSYLTDNEFVPNVTPDPVFAFNYNANHLIPTREEIVNKYNIPSDYILVSFKGSQSVNQEWITNFESSALKLNLACVKLPYADADAYGILRYNIPSDISPLDWYAIIKYSKGYIGNNMHPIVVSIHNNIPFYSFDNYGISKIDGVKTNGESSKIYHLLDRAELLQYRIFVNRSDYKPLPPLAVLDKLLNFDSCKENEFAVQYYAKYKTMMSDVYAAIHL